MNKILAFLLSTIYLLAFSQAPQGMNYQATVRTSQGNLVTNQAVGFKFNIRQGNGTGTVIYSETHTATSDQFGNVSLVIGQGTIISGSFSAINWASGTYFNEVLLDVSGGSNYVSMGASQLMSVPYALYAGTMPFNFYIYPNNDTINLRQGQTATKSFDFRWVDGTPTPISVSALNIPTGVTASFTSTALSLPDNSNTTLSVNAAGNTTVGVYPIGISGVGNGISKTATVYLNIKPCAPLFPGSYMVNEVCTVGANSYTSTISSNGNGITISNFGDLGINVTAAINCGNSTISIPAQTVSGNAVSGQGTFTYNNTGTAVSLTITYSVTNGGTTNTCTATYNLL
jgi:hypothetical protein